MSLRLTAVLLAAAAVSTAACEQGQDTALPEEASQAALEAANAAEAAEDAAQVAEDAAEAATDKAEEAGVVIPGEGDPTEDANPAPAERVPADDTKG